MHKTKKGKKSGNTPKVDDFFTKYIAKQHKKIGKKLDRIKELSKLNKDSLDDDQIALMDRRGEYKEQKKYFNGVKEVYLTAYGNALSNGSLKTQTQAQAEPAQETQMEETPEPANTVDEAKIRSEVIREVSDALANLLVVGSFFQNQSQRESFGSQNQSLLKNYGNNFLESVANTVAGLTTVDGDETNGDRIENLSSQLTNYLNKSNLIDTTAQISFNQISAGVNGIAQDQGFLDLGAAEEEEEVEEPQPESEEEAPAQEEQAPVQAQPATETQEQIKLVKTSAPESNRKGSKRSRLQSEADAFMAQSDDDDDDEEYTSKNVVEEKPKPKKNDGWQTVKKKEHPKEAERRNFRRRGRGRGGRGRGGRGRRWNNNGGRRDNYRGGNRGPRRYNNRDNRDRDGDQE